MRPLVVRWALLGLVAPIALGAGTLALGSYLSSDQVPNAGETLDARGIGGPFAMVDADGRPVTEADFAGRPMMLFFGFTACPAVCPTMLMQMTNWLGELGPLADAVQPIFVSVDPERDTSEVMKAYLSAFDERIAGLTGTPQQLAAFAEGYGVFYEKVPGQGDDYTMNHTAGVLLFDAAGAFVGTADFHDDPEAALGKLRRLAASAA